MIAGNGMCSGGRIVNYLKAMLHAPRHYVLFVRYQLRIPPVTPSRPMDHNAAMCTSDERISIRAGTISIGGYSGLADQNGLVKFSTGMQQWPSEMQVVHGEQEAKRQLSNALRQRDAQKNGK